MIRSFIVATVLALALTACGGISTMNQGASAQDIAGFLCSQPDVKGHCVRTTIVNGAIVVDPVDVHVPGPRDKPHWVIWYISTPGYQFVNLVGNRPVVFKTANGQFNPEDPINGCYHFSNNIVPPNSAVFVCVDRNTIIGRFPYTIKVTPTGSAPAVPPLDPSVFND
jgi:hypothetical protein